MKIRLTFGCILAMFAAFGAPGKDPAVVGRRLVERFLSRTPDEWNAHHSQWAVGKQIAYPTACVWDGALRFAKAVGDTNLLRRVAEVYEPFYAKDAHLIPPATHVDFTMFGAIPLEVYAVTGDRRALATGLAMADAQWAEPEPNAEAINGMADFTGQLAYWKDGYTPQTRLWIDDMFMISFVQLAAYQVTGKHHYVDRVAKEMTLYLDKLQNPDGLFYHAPDVPFVWGRGNGWMAVGLTRVLESLPVDNPHRERILSGYRRMMAALLKFQREDGMWGQLVDDPKSWPETSGSGMFAYAFIEGARMGLLDAKYGAAGRRAYLALVDYLTDEGDVREVCVGTNKLNDRNYYLARPRCTGDHHGQAPLLWCCAALLSAGNVACADASSVAGLCTSVLLGAETSDLASFVDPLVGTAGTGHCFPGPCRPFGLVQPSPETGNGSWKYCSGYNHDDTNILCFTQTHLSGSGQASLGDIAVMPVVADAAKRNEHAEVGYYAVEFAGGVKVEIAAGLRVARYRFTFPEGSPVGVRLDFKHGLYRDPSCLKYLNTRCAVEQIGMNGFAGENHSDIWAPRDVGYALQFNCDFDSYSNGVCTFAKGGVIELAVALSARSRKGAERNLAAEGDLSFEDLVRTAKREWNVYLSRLTFPGGDAATRTMFYTCLYHLCIQPNLISDADEPLRYSTFSLWDTYRSAHPLYEKLVPELVPAFVNSLLDHYDRFGYLPRWELWGRETNCMVGDPAVSVIADACLHGHRAGVDWDNAARAVKETLTSNRRRNNPGFYPPREERDVYAKYGYFPCDIVKAQSVSRTLENAYCDFKAAELMRTLGRGEDAAYFEHRSWNFTNLWDRTTLCFRPKNSKGEWLDPFEPARQSRHYTEGSPLQYSWFVPHRPQWLIAAMGGRETFLKRLDAFFAGALCPGQERGYSQDVTGLIGDYSHGNEPCHHIPALYASAGCPEKTDALVRRICAEFYKPTPAGLCGNDDCGQMSAWYLSSLAAYAAISDGASADLLESGFQNPPHAAKPQTWYHMMNGNVTKAGITRDFEALAEAGFGGVQMFDAGCDIPPGGLDFNSPEWFDLFRHAASEARRLGLEICIPNCSGWSSSGGPWNSASNAMKRVTFTETHAKGPSSFSAKLPREREDNGFYEDIAVLAFPTPPAESVRFDGVETRLDGATFTFISEKPFFSSGISFRLKHEWLWCGKADLLLEVSDDGKTFRPLETVVVSLASSGVSDFSLRYQPFKTPQTVRAIRGTFSGGPTALTVVEAHPEAKRLISNVKSKTFDLQQDVPLDRTPATSDQTVAKNDVLDLTAQLKPDDTLDWDVPAGDWTILRIGYVCNGRKNHPASDHGVGLEVDKLSAAAMDYHFEQYVARLCRVLGPLAGRVESGLNNILVDSYEVGSQNWTQGFDRTFKARRGYDLKPYLPVFSGRIVGSVEESERFLEDFRRVVADLFAENYAGKLTAKCRQYGLMCSIEPYGNCPADNLQYGEYVDIPMGEFWSNAAHPYSPDDGNAKYVSYIAHVWGKRFCATESFTAAPGATSGRWMTTPFGIKAQGDLAYSDGVNRLIYHRFTHQPWADDKYLPGMTMGRWGMHLDRTQTWWPYAKPFFRYQARCQHMLQRGTFVADVLYFAGEEAPNRGGNMDDGSRTFGAELPFGYDWDVCPTDAMHELKVVDGEVVVPGGVHYPVLAMPPVEAMTPKMLRTVARLQREGAKIAWTTKPTRSPGLSFGAAGDGEVRRLADEIFASGILQMSAADAIKNLGVQPQVAVLGPLPKDVQKLNWIHRCEKDADWFFVAMPNRDPAALELSFRVNGREPEIWDAETGKVSPAEVWRMEGGRTIVRVPFDVCGSKFVVFRKPTAATRSALEAPQPVVDSVICVTGPWQVSFPHDYLPNPLAKGVDEVVTFVELEPWNERTEEGVRYFSGSATYRKEIAVPEQMREGARLILELGRVCEVAEVTVNGRTFDALWHPPFSVDITDAIKDTQASQNPKTLSLSIRVANLWANRLIGDDRKFAPDCEWTGSLWKGVKEMPIKEIPKWVKDGQPSPTGRHTFTTFKHWDKDDQLLPSGLLGPVKLHVREWRE